MNAVATLWNTTRDLLGACGWALRRERRLWAFPALSVAAGFLVAGNGLLTAGLMRWRAGAAVGAPDDPGPALQWDLLAVLLPSSLVSMGLIALMFVFNAAFVHSALRVLRCDPAPAVAAAIRAMLAQWPRLLGFALLAVGGGLAIGILMNQPQTLLRLSSSLLGIAYSALLLLGLPALIGERRGPVAAVRRAAQLLKKRWGEAALGSAALWGLMVPITILNSLLLGALGNPGTIGASLAMAGFGFTASTAMSFLAALYGTALYVLAVEGEVPRDLDPTQSDVVWRAGSSMPSADAPVRLARRPASAVGAALVAAAAVLFMLAVAWFPELAFRSERFAAAIGSVRPDSTASMTAAGPFRPLWRRELPESIFTVGLIDGDVVAAGYATVYFLNQRGELLRQFRHRVGLSTMLTIARFGEPGTPAIVLSGTWSRGITAYSTSGERLWTSSSESGVNVLGTVRIPGEGDLVFVGHNGSHGLCLLDRAGAERWCNDDIGNVRVAAALDCTGDGLDEVVSESKNSHPYFGFRLGCYAVVDGSLVADLPIPGQPLRVVSRDVDADGAAELVVLHLEGAERRVRLTVSRPAGEPLRSQSVDLEFGEAAMATLETARFRPGADADVLIQLRSGAVQGLTPDADRWVWQVPESFGDSLLVADLSGDGAEEVVTADGPAVAAWAWAATGAVSRRDRGRRRSGSGTNRGGAD